MSLNLEDRRLLMETLELARSTHQTIHEVVKPILLGSNGHKEEGLLVRVGALEDEALVLKAGLKTVALVGAVVTTLIGLVLTALTVWPL